MGNMIAVGAYLRTLRDARDISRQTLAAQFGTSISNMSRIENGEQDTRSTLLYQILDAVGGDPRDVAMLMLNERATAQDGIQAARRCLVRQDTLPDPQTLSDREVAAELAWLLEKQDKLRDRPEVVDQVRRFMDFLLNQ